MISITAPTHDTAGRLVIARTAAELNLLGTTRRVTRTKTLDGGVSVVDFGSTHADRTWRIRLDHATAEQVATARRLVSLYETVTVATDEGLFRAVPLSAEYDDGLLAINLDIIELLA